MVQIPLKETHINHKNLNHHLTANYFKVSGGEYVDELISPRENIKQFNKSDGVIYNVDSLIVDNITIEIIL